MDTAARLTIAISLDRQTRRHRLKSTSTTATHTRPSRLTILGIMDGPTSSDRAIKAEWAENPRKWGGSKAGNFAKKQGVLVGKGRIAAFRRPFQVLSVLRYCFVESDVWAGRLGALGWIGRLSPPGLLSVIIFQR